MTPVCAPDGTVFDLLHIVPYLERYGKNPATSQPLHRESLIRLHFSKNPSGTQVLRPTNRTSTGEYFCPITSKTFNDHSRILANRRTGNVYSAEGIEGVGVEAKGWRDFLTEEPFTRADLITIQDPAELHRRNMAEFSHVKSAREADGVPYISPASASKHQKIEPKGATAAILDTLKSQKAGGGSGSFYTKGKVSSSLTSTSITPHVSEEQIAVSQEDRMFSLVKGSSRAVIRTNLGDLYIELHCQKAPRACYNFIQLAKRGCYAGVKFHRLLPGFVVQGGDPDGTGSGGKSCWGKPFDDEFAQGLSHNARGVLSMANKGRPRTNTSQFFITLAPAPHLDRVHPIFGRVVSGWEALARIESSPTDAAARPTPPVLMQDVIVMDDPFEECLKGLAGSVGSPSEARSRRLETDPTAMVRRAKAATNTPATIGRYLAGRPAQ